MNYKITKSDKIFKGKVFDIQVDEIEYDSGNGGRREVVIHPGGAVAVPVTDDGKIILVKQFRYPFKEKVLELPAGKLDEGEDPQICAVRELEEETGYKPATVKKLGAIYTSPGFCTEILHIYLTENLEEGTHNREEGEIGMEVLEFTLEEIQHKITSGEIVDAKTISGIHYYQLYREGKYL
jgi:ADP-ribose pyrophosphatase